MTSIPARSPRPLIRPTTMKRLQQAVAAQRASANTQVDSFRQQGTQAAQGAKTQAAVQVRRVRQGVVNETNRAADRVERSANNAAGKAGRVTAQVVRVGGTVLAVGVGVAFVPVLGVAGAIGAGVGLGVLAWNGLKGVSQTIGAQVGSFISSSGQKLGNGLRSLGTTVSNKVGELAGKAKEGTKKVGSVISEGSKKVGDFVSNGAKSVGNAISHAWKSLW